MAGPWEKYRQNGSQPAQDAPQGQPWAKYSQGQAQQVSGPVSAPNAPLELTAQDYERYGIPQGTPREEVRSILSGRLEASKSDQHKAVRKLDALNYIGGAADKVSRFGNAALLGLPDYYYGKMTDLSDRAQGIEGTDNLKQVQDVKQDYFEQAPKASTAASLGGAIFGFGKMNAAGLVPSAAIKGKGAAATTAGAALDGAALGGIESFLAEREQTGKDAATGGAIAAGANLLFRGAGNVLAPIFRGKKPAVPTTRNLLDDASKLRGQIDDMGVTFSPDQLKQLYRRVTNELPISGMDAVEGKAAETIRRLGDNMDRPATMSQLDKLRQKAAPNKVSATPSELRESGIVRSNIDDFMNSIDPAQGGREAKALLDQSRNATRMGRNAERIEDIISSAKDNAAGTLAGRFKTQEDVRRQLKNLMKKKEFNFFKPEEQDAIRKVVQGGGVDTIARLLGKAQPTGVVSGGIGGFAAASSPLGAMVPIGGTMARQIADARTRKATTDLLRQIKAGSKQAAARPETAFSKALTDAENQRLLALLTTAGAISAN